MIPAQAHFIWFGSALPWVHALAVRSAALRGDFERVILHHADEPDGEGGWPGLKATARVEFRPLTPDEVLGRVERVGKPLAELYGRLRAPAAKTNVLRVAILAQEGGVYLDTDTVTIASFDHVRNAAAFCATERIAFPAHAVWTRNPLRLLRSIRLHVQRERLCRRPDGWREFLRIEGQYEQAATNAILASEPGHGFVVGLMERMLALPQWRQTVRYALGTHALQQHMAQYGGGDLVLHPPDVFCPLSPRISAQWFVFRAEASLDGVLSARTRAVHWYASLHGREWASRLGPDHVRAHARDQLFSALAFPFINGNGHD